MEILHVITSLGISGGAEQQLVSNLRRFTESRFQHRLLCVTPHDYGSRLDELPDGMRVEFVYGSDDGPGGRVETVRRIVGKVADNRPALIHASLADAALGVRIAGRRLGIPIVETLVNISHEAIRTVDNPGVSSTKLRAHRVLDRITMRWVTQFIALSETVARSWTRVVGLPPAKIQVIPRGVDADEMVVVDRDVARQKLTDELGLPDDAFILLNVGRQVAQKGHRFLFEALAGIASRMPEAVVVVAGQPGAVSESLRDQIGSLGLQDRVFLLGARSDIPSLMAAADVFVFPSVYEGFGVSLLQAMAAGLPCVAFDHGPMNELIEDDRTGVLVAFRDIGALGESLVALHGDPERRLRLGKSAQMRAGQEFSADRIAAATESLYRRILNIAD